MHHDIKYYVLDQEPTPEQYAVSSQTPLTVPTSKNGTKWLLKCADEITPEVLAGEKVFDHEGFMLYAYGPEWG